MISIRRSLAVAAVFCMGGLAAATLPSPDIGFSYSHLAGTTVRTATILETAVDYDGDRHRLSLRCVKSSNGSCRFAVDNAGRRGVVSVNPGHAAILPNIVESGRLCSGGADLQLAGCKWAPVRDPALSSI